MDKLDKIITQLDDLEISQKHREDLLKRNQATFLLKLPKVILIQRVCGFLNYNELYRFTATCSTLRKVMFCPLGFKLLMLSRNANHLVGGPKHQQIQLKHEKIDIISCENLSTNNNIFETEEDALEQLEVLKAVKDFLTSKLQDSQATIQKLQDMLEDVQATLKYEKSVNLKLQSKINILQNQLSISELQRQDVKENLAELNSKYNKIIIQMEQDRITLLEDKENLIKQKKVLIEECSGQDGRKLKQLQGNFKICENLHGKYRSQIYMNLLMINQFLMMYYQHNQKNQQQLDNLECVFLIQKSYQIFQFQLFMDYQLPSLADPFTWISYSILGILVGLSQAGGIGGGPIISPVMMVLLGCPSKKAIWNTYIMLLGGSLGNFLRLGKERTVNGSAPLINYQLVQITLPLLLAGAILGVATGKWMPKLIIVIFLFGILLTVFLKTKSLYIKTRNKEMNEKLIPVELKELTIQKESHHSKELNIIKEKDARLYPIEPLTEISLTILIIIVVTLLKGSGAVPSILGIEFCGYGYHFLNFVIFGIAFYNVQRYRKYISKDEEYKESIGYDFTDGKMSSVFDITVKSSLYAGFLGGLVGLGGGVVLTPLWLETGINPPRAAASATFTVLFTSSISVFIIALSGGYQFTEFIILGLVSSFGSYLVAGFLKKLVKKYKRESILIQVLLGVIAFGLVILPFQSIKDVYQNPLGAIQFGRLC